MVLPRCAPCSSSPPRLQTRSVACGVSVSDLDPCDASHEAGTVQAVNLTDRCTREQLAIFLAEVLAEAGELVMALRDSALVVNEKTPHEIVTDADLVADRHITTRLLAAHPGVPVFSEEGGKGHRSAALTRWIVDPIDGTTPWVWGNSGFAMSVALEVDGCVQAGAVYDPVMREFFFAASGHGATRNGASITTRAGTPLARSLLVVDWGNADEKRAEGLAYFQKFFLPDLVAARVVPQFAPALGLCRVAEGRVHGLVCNDTWVEDHAAGALILREAGGVVTNFYSRAGFRHREAGVIAAADLATHGALCAVVDR